jgi:hypothetical protein
MSSASWIETVSLWRLEACECGRRVEIVVIPARFLLTRAALQEQSEYMSNMILESHAVPTAASDGNHIFWVHAFARYVNLQRRALGLSLGRAAKLSGMQVCAWIAMEEGRWVPEDLNVIRSIEGTLEVRRGELDTIALIARFQQSQCA